MDLRLQFLDSFAALGSDGGAYKVCAYDRLVPDVSLGHADRWESTGQTEYRLPDGRPVAVAKDGVMTIAGSDVVLQPVGQSQRA